MPNQPINFDAIFNDNYVQFLMSQRNTAHNEVAKLFGDLQVARKQVEQLAIENSGLKNDVADREKKITDLQAKLDEVTSGKKSES